MTIFLSASFYILQAIPSHIETLLSIKSYFDSIGSLKPNNLLHLKLQVISKGEVEVSTCFEFNECTYNVIRPTLFQSQSGATP